MCCSMNGGYVPRSGSTTARGYGAAHQRERAKWKPHVEAGLVDCARCGKRIQPGMAWDLGHTDDRAGYTGPECRRCNRADGGRKSHAKPVPRRWAL